MENNIQVGSKVKFAQELTPNENQFEMVVVELNGDRCLIVTDIGFGNLNPQRVVMVADLVPQK